MGDPVARACELYKNGLSCSQSVFAAFAPSMGLDEQTALAIASPFGGGYAGRGDVCGAVTGALMVIGLRYGHLGKARASEISRGFLEDFQAASGTTTCRDLLGFDLSTPEGRAAMKKMKQSGEDCTPFVREAAQLVASMLESEI